MRGGRESVIGLVPFNPTSPAYSTNQTLWAAKSVPKQDEEPRNMRNMRTNKIFRVFRVFRGSMSFLYCHEI